MRRIWAVIGNTFISAIRMKIAIVFLLLLIILLPLLSVNSTGDGTVKGQVQSFVSYGLGLTGFLLSILTIIISCYSLSSDIKHRRIYTVVTKPPRRWEIIVGKLLGVMLLNGLLLFVFASVIYALVLQMPRFNKASDAEIAKLNNEFFTARRTLVMKLDTQAIENAVQQTYQRLLSTNQLDESRTKQEVLAELRKAEKLRSHSAQAGGMLMWEFENVKPMAASQSIFIRFKYDASQTPADENINATWYVGDYRQLKYGFDRRKTPIYSIPSRNVVRTVHEIEVPASAVASDGYLAVAFHNSPVNRTTVIFPMKDGFEVLYRAGTFTGNFTRAVLLLFVRLFFLAAMGVSLSAWLSFPVAILCCLTVFFTGTINSFVVDSFDYLGKNISLFYILTVKPLIWFLPKFDGDSNIGKYVIEAKLISLKFLFVSFALLIVKALILLMAGVFIFSKREIARITV